MRKITLIVFLAFIFGGCEKEVEAPVISVHGDWRLDAWGYLHYNDSVETAGQGYVYEDIIRYNFKNGIIRNQSGNISGNYTATTIKLNSNPITFTITNLTSTEMRAKQYPNGIANGVGEMYIFRR